MPESVICDDNSIINEVRAILNNSPTISVAWIFTLEAVFQEVK